MAANRPLVGLAEWMRQRLEGHNLFTAQDVLLHSALDLMELCHVTAAQAEAMLAAVSGLVCPPYSTALELQQEAAAVAPLLTHLPDLDAALRRGVPHGGITELVGPGGVGKSQLCHMLALLAVAPADGEGAAAVAGEAAAPSSQAAGPGSSGRTVIYIDTEKKFSSVRFAEMARSRFPQQLGTRQSLEAAMGRVILICPESIEALLHTLMSLEAGIVQHRARLVILDSVAALARAEFGGGRVVERQERLGQVASQLKYLAESFKIPVLVTNQVTTRIGATAPAAAAAAASYQQQQQQGMGIHHSSYGQQQQSAGGQLGGWGGRGAAGGGGGFLTAALGTKWAHCVNVRIVLERLGDRRFLTVAKSPASQTVTLEYGITPRGVEQVVGAEIPAVVAQHSVIERAIANEVEYGMQV